MTDRWLVALDIDGTTVREDDSLSARVADAVRAVVDAGHLVVPAFRGRVEPKCCRPAPPPAEIVALAAIAELAHGAWWLQDLVLLLQHRLKERRHA